jgi:hypothetical protein
MPGFKKIRFEVFWVEEPSLIFRCDLLSHKVQDGSHILMEKINIVDKLQQMRILSKEIASDQYKPEKFRKDGLVLAICESNFPHQICFMLIEPCSHIQWEFAYCDNKLSVIETRQQRLNFIMFLH